MQQPLTRASCETAFPWRNALTINAAIAVIVTAMAATFDTGWTITQFLRSLAASLLISNCIGLLAQYAIGRLWPWFEVRGGWVRAAGFIGLLATVAAVGALFATVLLTAAGVFAPARFWASYGILVRGCMFITLVFGGGAWYFEALRERLQKTTLELRTKDLERERAMKLATEARLSSLESRIHPHFLFNALNSISSLIRNDPARAEHLLLRMSALLRFSLDSAQARLVPLGRELKIVSDYLEIEQARFGARLRYCIEVPPELENVEVPPLAVQTLVENSVKYAVAARREGATIRIRARTDEGRARIEVCDDGPGFAHEAIPSGHGIDNLQARLATLFGERGSLHIIWNAAGITVSFTVPLQVQERASA
ncbi:MAG TPA: histidine kinase [Bryobacteraceae bacterium]|nr:histidine kinase [Bryobacteraceae bacterium]